MKKTIIMNEIKFAERNLSPAFESIKPRGDAFGEFVVKIRKESGEHSMILLM
jgi:hypothetical protein